MEHANARWDNSERSRGQDAGDRSPDYLDLAAQTGSTGMDGVADTARQRLDSGGDPARSVLTLLTRVSERAAALRDRNAALARGVADSVAARPLLAIGMAAAIGYLAGRAIRGRY